MIALMTPLRTMCATFLQPLRLPSTSQRTKTPAVQPQKTQPRRMPVRTTQEEDQPRRRRTRQPMLQTSPRMMPAVVPCQPCLSVQWQALPAQSHPARARRKPACRTHIQQRGRRTVGMGALAGSVLFDPKLKSQIHPLQNTQADKTAWAIGVEQRGGIRWRA